MFSLETGNFHLFSSNFIYCLGIIREVSGSDLSLPLINYSFNPGFVYSQETGKVDVLIAYF